MFDEPLSNLDAKLRVEMRTEIKKLQQRLGATVVYVTHDQIEAMTADRWTLRRTDLREPLPASDTDEGMRARVCRSARGRTERMARLTLKAAT